jgi:hypothetical protein
MLFLNIVRSIMNFTLDEVDLLQEPGLLADLVQLVRRRLFDAAFSTGTFRVTLYNVKITITN